MLTSRYKYISVVFFVILGFIIPLATLNIGICEFDECYQIICSQYYADQPLAPLSFYLSNLWIQMFGDEVMSYRYFAYIVNTLLIAIPVLYYYNSTRRLLRSAAMFLILQLSYNIFMASFFNWDVPSNFFIVCSVCLILSYYKTDKLTYLIALAGVTACATLCRMPNISLFCFSLLFIVYVASGLKFKLLHSTVYISTYLCTYILVIYLIFGGVFQYVATWNDDNIISGHTSILSIFAWINGAPQRELPMLFMAVTMFAMIYLLHRFGELNNKFYLFSIIAFWWGYLSLTAFTQSLSIYSSYQVGFFYLLVGLYIASGLHYKKLTLMGGGGKHLCNSSTLVCFCDRKR